MIISSLLNVTVDLEIRVVRFGESGLLGTLASLDIGNFQTEIVRKIFSGDNGKKFYVLLCTTSRV